MMMRKNGMCVCGVVLATCLVACEQEPDPILPEPPDPVKIDKTFLCEPKAFADDSEAAAEARTDFRKMIALDMDFVGGSGFEKLDLTKMTIGYQNAPTHAQSDEDTFMRYQVEDGFQQVLNWWDQSHPGMVQHENGECTFAKDVTQMVQTFDFVEDDVRYFRVLDVDSVLICNDEKHVGSRNLLLWADLKECLDKFCSTVSLLDDPYCERDVVPEEDVTLEGVDPSTVR